MHQLNMDLVESKVELLCRLNCDDDSVSEENFDTNVAGTFKAITSTNQYLSHLRRAPAVYPIDVRHICPRVKAAITLGITGDNRTNETTEEVMRSFAVGLTYRAPC